MNQSLPQPYRTARYGGRDDLRISRVVDALIRCKLSILRLRFLTTHNNPLERMGVLHDDLGALDLRVWSAKTRAAKCWPWLIVLTVIMGLKTLRVLLLLLTLIISCWCVSLCLRRHFRVRRNVENWRNDENRRNVEIWRRCVWVLWRGRS